MIEHAAGRRVATTSQASVSQLSINDRKSTDQQRFNNQESPDLQLRLAPMRHLFLVLVGWLIAATAFAQTPPDGAAVFEKACASCHAKPAPDSRAPTREVLRSVAPEAILTALTVGNMFR